MATTHKKISELPPETLVLISFSSEENGVGAISEITTAGDLVAVEQGGWLAAPREGETTPYYIEVGDIETFNVLVSDVFVNDAATDVDEEEGEEE